MTDMKFSSWMKWNERTNISLPGIYVIAILEKDISGQSFKWIEQIKYIGMTNAITGLKGRLYAFNQTISGKRVTHGGAHRFRFKYIDKPLDEDNTLNREQLEQDLINKLYVSVMSFECDVKSYDDEDLRIMGEVVKAEYDCFADYVKAFKCLPEFNCKERSPKTWKQYEKLKKDFPC